MNKVVLFVILCLAISASCNKDQYAYREFLNDREIVYAGLAENLNYRSGMLRVQLEWQKSIDPAVANYIIYWNNDRDSVKVPASAIDADGVYRHVITDLPEYGQSFRMVAENDRGYRSVGQTITGVKVFGPIYNSTLNNQRLESRMFFGTDSVTLYFSPTDSTRIFSEIRYTKSDGNIESVRFEEDLVTIKWFMPGTKPTLRSFYLPEPTAIDTFSVLTVDTLLAF